MMLSRSAGAVGLRREAGAAPQSSSCRTSSQCRSRVELPRASGGRTATPKRLRRRLAATSSGPLTPPGAVPSEGGGGQQPIGTLMLAQGYKAYWLPAGGDVASPEPCKGVVLFLHGFAQSPKAYYNSLLALAAKGLLVVAPAPCFYATPEEQQTAMVEHAAFFLERISAGTLPKELGLGGRTAGANVALLAHSVGGGLATHVAAVAAKAGRPLKAVAVLAPQTKVVGEFAAEAALELWPRDDKSTSFLIQFGWLDTIAPFSLACELQRQLKERFGDGTVAAEGYGGGTHVGFEDQLFLVDADVDEQVLPWLNVVIILLAAGVPFLPLLVKQLLRAYVWVTGAKLGSECAEQRRKAPDGTCTDYVSDLPPGQSLAKYTGLLAATAALFGALLAVTRLTWDRHPEDGIRWLPAVLASLVGFATVAGTLEILLNWLYINPVQRPQSRAKSVEFICSALGIE